jgi:hypothetical protein
MPKSTTWATRSKSCLDFRRLFHRLEGDGYRGPYMLTFGNRAEKLAGRDYLLEQANSAR